MHLYRSSKYRYSSRPLAIIFLFIVISIVSFFLLTQVQQAKAIVVLDVEIIAGYNLVVDSNVLSPSTYAPSVATVAGRICNTGSTPADGVQAFIGDQGAGTPGLYPDRGPGDAGFNASYPHLAAQPGRYAFTHVGGRLGTGDATRLIGTLNPGACRMQYWHFTYPRRSNLAADNDNLGPDPVWGDTNITADDLWLEFDVWAMDNAANSDTATWRMTMRNEISAMANKIKPNPDGRWFNTNTNIIPPGGVITSNGILYELGNINQGFDNDGDFAPDYNAWLQPVGDPAYDPTCFRLIRTSGVLTVSRSAMPDLIIPFDDQNPALSAPYGGPLYFTNLPPGNNGVVGKVFYTFQSLTGPCSTSLSPYQEVASGYDNEKFNGDYGAGIPPVGSRAAEVTLDKSSSPNTVPTGGTINYTIPFVNTGTEAAPGLPLSSGAMPLVISDTVPAGLTFQSASATFTGYPGGVAMLYSSDSGATWTSTAPTGQTSTSPNNLILVQWWLEEQLPASASGEALLTVGVPGGYSGSSFIENCADARFGTGIPFAEACTITVVQGANSLGDRVWQDEDGDGNQDAGEAAIVNVTVTLYWDRNGDGVLDADDYQISTQATSALDPNYLFSQLPNGSYIVVVDTGDADLPAGYSPTTAVSYAVSLSGGVSDLDNDFGFGPTLRLTKALSSDDPSYEGDLVTYTIDLENTRPGNGTGQPANCVYTVWATVAHPTTGVIPPGGGPTNAQWQNTPNALNAPDGLYANTQLSNNPDTLGLSGFNIGPQSGNITNVTLVNYVREDVNFRASDAYFIDVYSNDAVLAGATFSYDGTTLPGAVGVPYTISEDITAVKTWTWADFAFNATEMQVEGNGGGGTPTGEMSLDAAAYIITTDQLCGGPEDTIDPLPLADTYDDAILEFVSADPPPTSAGGGTVTWSNVGPLYAGGTHQVTVTFRAVAVASPGNTCVPHTNTGSSTGATFINGEAVNDAGDSANHTVCPAGSIGDLVWNDIVADGVYDSDGADNIAGTADDERGIPGVTVYLCNDGVEACSAVDAVETAVTDAAGLYLFQGLPDGTQYVTAVNMSTLPNGGAGAANTDDRDADNDSNSGFMTLNNTDGVTTNDDITNADFGYSMPTLIEGALWHDYNRSGLNDDGSADAGEEGLAGITVYLDDGVCTYPGTCLTAVTDANGEFVFVNPPPAAYTVRVDTATGPLATGTWTQSFDTPNGPDGVPGTGDDARLIDDAVAVTVVAGGYGRADYSYYQTGSSDIGDTLYIDWDGDGVEESGEGGIPNVTVWLYEDSNGDGVIDLATDALIMTDTTDAGGVYLFAGLPAGDYIVLVDEDDSDLPSSYAQTGDPDEAGTCVVCDNQGSVTVDGTNDDLDQDFGYRPTGAATIGDLVWEDLNRNTAPDGGENGIANITVNLYVDDGDGIFEPGTDDAFVGTTTTDADGSYQFTGLYADGTLDYWADVDETDADLPTAGGGPYVLTTIDPHAVANLVAGSSYEDADFGFTPGGTIGDYFWRDTNGDGFQDAGEPGISGVDVYLCLTSPCTSGNAIQTDITDANGLYEFTALAAFTYYVAFDATDIPAGYSQTFESDVPTADVPGCATCDGQVEVLLAAGQTDRSRDFGFQPFGVIGDTLWIDEDGDGVRDAGESGIPGVTVYLCASSPCSSGTAVSSTTTDINGYYSFGDLVDGTYFVGVESGQVPAALVQTYDPDGAIDGEAGSIVISGGVVTSIGGSPCANCDLDIDFGYQYQGPNSASGTVFYDENDNAIQDVGETLTYASVTIYLWHCGPDNDCAATADNQYFGSALTDVNGDYTFSSLPDGRYVVSVNADAPNLIGLDPTVTTSPTTFREVDLDQAGTNPAAVNATDQDFGVLSALDLGDLPDSYGTSLNNDGARHTASGILYLGSGVSPDTDPNGQVSADAGRSGLDGDDGDGSDDEDGMAQAMGGGGTLHWGDGTGHIVMDVTGNGCLLGWADWNENGQFDAGQAPSELILNQFVSTGTGQALTFPSPVSTAYGGTYAYPIGLNLRFRLFPPHDPRFGNMALDANGCPTSGNNEAALNNLSTGPASLGEVEDYQWQFLSPTAVNLLSFGSGDNLVTLGLMVAGVLALLLLTISLVVMRLQRRMTTLY